MEIIDQIRQTANIVEIAAQYTNLKKSGRRHVGLCPFHSEKTPSFFLDEDKQLFHCFGCGAGGDLFTLVMEKENMSFPEAVRLIAEKYNIKIPEKRAFSPQYQSLKEKLYKITEDTLAYYKKNLFNTTEGKKALDYLKKRKISEEAIQTLKIGYALNSWDSLLTYFKRKKVSSETLEKAGLVLRRQNKEGFYDRFRGRIIFPIFHHQTNKVVAFGGRTLYDEEPKYLNSPDTPIYSKGNLLYGLNFTRDDIRSLNEMILVEGYTDFLALYQADIKNVAASLGTSLTAPQIDLVRRRYTTNIVACYDGDIAGRKASYRAVSLGFEQGARVKVAMLPRSMDPDSYIQKFGAVKFTELIAKSLAGLNFIIGFHTKGKRPNAPEEKARIAREVFKEIEKIPDTIVKSEYLKKTAEYLNIEEKEFRATITQKTRPTQGAEAISFFEAEKRLLQIIFGDSRLSTAVFKDIGIDDYKDLKSAPIFELFADFFKNGKYPDFHELKENIDPSLFSFLSEILLEQSDPPTLQETRDCLDTLRQYTLSQKLQQLKSQIARLKKMGEQDKIPALLSEIMDINKHLYELSQRGA